MENAIQKFKEAALAFQQEECYKKLDEARKTNDNDTELQSMLGEFNLVRLDLNNEIGKDDRNEERVSQLNTRINELYNGIMGNPHMLAYNEAKENVEEFIHYVNAILNAAIDGEDPMLAEPPAPSEGCGGSCASCSGCS